MLTLCYPSEMRPRRIIYNEHKIFLDTLIATARSQWKEKSIHYEREFSESTKYISTLRFPLISIFPLWVHLNRCLIRS